MLENVMATCFFSRWISSKLWMWKPRIALWLPGILPRIPDQTNKNKKILKNLILPLDFEDSWLQDAPSCSLLETWSQMFRSKDSWIGCDALWANAKVPPPYLPLHCFKRPRSCKMYRLCRCSSPDTSIWLRKRWPASSQRFTERILGFVATFP